MPPEPVRVALDAVPAEPQVLDTLHDLIEHAWTQCPSVSDTDRMAVELVVAEIVTNIIEHAGGVGRELTAAVTINVDCIEVDLRDTGRPFPLDLSAVRLPGDMSERGRGLAMAKALTDEIAYLREGDLNRWRLVRHRTP